MGKRRRKVKLPCDRNGKPINVGDWVLFSDGPFHVETLCYMGEGYGWYAEDDNGVDTDNLGGGIVITYPKGEK